jgi:hypothetical protein
MSRYVMNYDADVYFTTRLNSELWDKQSEDRKTAALTTATRYIDTLNFAGSKTDSVQALEFPRGGDLVVPQRIKDACCEIAYALLDGRDIEYEGELLENSALGMGDNRQVSDTDVINLAKVHGIPSRLAWDMLLPCLQSGSEITISRVN